MKNLFIKLSFFFLISFLVSLNVSAYTDVDETDKYFNAIEFISEHEIVSGYNDGTFKPDGILNRAELTKIVISSNYQEADYAKYADDECFIDVPANTWFTQYVCFAKAEGIVEGYEGNVFNPESKINLVEALKITMEVFGYAYSEEIPWYKGIVDEASARNFIPNDMTSFEEFVNRGQMADLITRLIKTNNGSLDEYLQENKNYNVSFASLANNLKITDWQSYINTDHGYSILYPKNWRKIDFTGEITGFGVGPEDMSEDILWGMNIYSNSDNSVEDIINKIGDQFGDSRTVAREDIDFYNGLHAIKVIVTTSLLDEWYSETVIVENGELIYVFSNGAEKNSEFRIFYESFRFIDNSDFASSYADELANNSNEASDVLEDENTDDTEYINLPDLDMNFAYFDSESFNFRIIYPARLYYNGTTSEEEGVSRSYIFSEEDPNEVEEISKLIAFDLISHDLLIDPSEGVAIDTSLEFAYKKYDGDLVYVYVISSDDRAFRLSANKQYEDILVNMAASIVPLDTVKEEDPSV